MKSFTTLRNLYSSITGRTAATDLTLADQWINDGHRFIVNSWNWPFLEKSTTTATVAGTQFYKLPYNLGKILDITVTIGNYQYTPREVSSRKDWDLLNQATQWQANYPVWYYLYQGQVGIWPTPSSSSLTVTINYKVTSKDLSIADYTTGTITSIASGGTAVVGSGTSWTSQMSGRFIQFTDGNAANSGDNYWYEISSVGSTTALSLVKPYGGNSISAATAAYTIGQMPLIPEGYHEMPVYYACHKYYLAKNELARAKEYKAIFDDLYTQLKHEYGEKSTSPVIESGDFPITNPNLIVTL